MTGRLSFLLVTTLVIVAMSLSGPAFAQGCGEVWNPVSLPENGTELYAGIWANNQFVVGGNGAILASPDGLTWTYDAGGTFGWVTGIAYGAGRYVAAVATDQAVLISKDRPPLAQAPGGGWRFVRGRDLRQGPLCRRGAPWACVDKPGWPELDQTSSGFQKGVPDQRCVRSGRFVAVGVGGVIVTSTDGIAWHRRTAKPVGQVNSMGLSPRITYGPAGFVVVDDRTILTSHDGKSWTRMSVPESYYLQSVTYTGSAYVAVGDVILTSPDGVTWTLQTAPATRILYGVVSSGSTILALGGYDRDAAVLMSTCSP